MQVPQQMRSLRKSFHCAFRGLFFCIRNERNMRIHLVAGGYVLAFSPFFHLSRAEYGVLLLTIALVIGMEAVNTAVEAAINMQAQWYDSLARVGKDAAAGAVLVCALFAAAVGLVLFLRPAVLLFIVEYLCVHAWLGLLFLASLAGALWFIFFFPFQMRRP